MTIRTPRVAVVGVGLVGSLHAQAAKALHDANEVVFAAIVEPHPQRRSETALRYGVTAFERIEELFKRCAVDAVIVATPVASHAEAVAACARAEVHVLCEKPLAVALEDAQEMIRACHSAGVQLGYAASYRHLPAMREAKRLIDAGAIGDVLIMREQIVGGSGSAGHVPMGAQHYPAGGPGGSGLGLMDHGVHLIDAFGWLCNAPVVRAWGRGNISGAPPRSEFLHMDFANGAIGQLLYNDSTFSDVMPAEGVFAQGAGWTLNGESKPGSWLADPGVIHVHGSKGALRIYHYANQLFMFDAEGSRQIPITDPPAPAHFIAQLRAFVRAINRSEPYQPDGHTGLAALKVLHAAYDRPLASNRTEA